MRPTSEAIGNWIGRRLAEVVMFLRDKPFLPSDVDWYSHNVEFMFEGNDEWRYQKRAVGPHDYLFEDDGDCYCTDTIGEFRDTLGTS